MSKKSKEKEKFYYYLNPKIVRKVQNTKEKEKERD
jgi:hypothetical protein